jgi:hypothetical protein
MKKVVIAGSGNAALCAGIAALEQGAEALILEKANANEAGGNSRYTAGAMRFVYQRIFRARSLPLGYNAPLRLGIVLRPHKSCMHGKWHEPRS